MTIKEKLALKQAWLKSDEVRLVLRVLGGKLVAAKGKPLEKKQEELPWLS